LHLKLNGSEGTETRSLTPRQPLLRNCTCITIFENETLSADADQNAMSEDFTISWFWRKITPEFHDGFAECTTSNIDRKEEGNSFFLYVVKRKCQRWQTSETALVN